MKKMLFFVNPAAGKEEMRFQLMDVIDYFTANSYDVLCHPTQKPLDIPEFLQERGEEFDMVVTCGGDGTLNETVSGLMTLNRRPVLGYIPAGTVNDFATSLHIPKTIKEAAQNIVEGEVFPVDMGGFISVSARSLGEVNVQVIMEKLGGGGHLTMAGAQMKDVSLEKTKVYIMAAIDEYRRNQAEEE